MRKKVFLTALLVLLSSSGLAADAVISRNEPLDPVVLEDSNSYEQKKEYDGTPSTPDSVSYSWQWIENSVSKTGPKVNFTFNRDAPNGSSQPQTIELVVSTDTDSNSTSVSQPIRDIPNASISADQTTVDISDSDTDVKFTSEATNVFNQPSSGIVNYDWEIDGTSYENTSSFTYDFGDNDTTDYNVTLNVSDTEDYWSLEQQTISVENNSDSGSSTSSGGGGGGGGGGSGSGYDRSLSFNNFSEDEFRDLSILENSFRTLSFTAVNDVTNPFFGIYIRDSKPDSITESVPGDKYEFFEIDEKNISSDDVEGVSLEFRVSNDWMDNKNASEDEIVLFRYSNGWNALDTEFSDRFNGYHHFEADSPGLSNFAVAKLDENIVVTDISLADDDPTAGNPFNISVEVSNTGSSSGTRIVNTTAAGETYSSNLTLENGTTETLHIRLNLSEGNYTASADTKSLSFEVSSGDISGEDSDGSQNEGELVTQQDSQNQTDQEPAGEDDSGSMLMIALPALTFMMIVLGGVGYIKRDEIEEFLEEKDIQLPFQEEEQMNVPEQYEALTEKIDELGVDDQEISIKMDHARMLLDQGNEARAAEILGEVSDRLLHDLE